MTSNTITLADFIAANRLTMEATWADDNPHMSDMPAGSTHWLCVITSGNGETMSLHFSQGPAHTSEPDLPTVLDCIASDVASVRNEPDWLTWAEDLGYEGAEGYRQARAAHDAIAGQGADLERLLSDDAMETLLWNTERL